MDLIVPIHPPPNTTYPFSPSQCRISGLASPTHLPRLQGLKRLPYQLASEVSLLLRRKTSVARDVNDPMSQDDTVGAHHLGNGQGRCYLNHRDAGLLQLGCDRSAAASAGASGRGEDHGVYPFSFHLMDHLLAHPAGVR